MKYVRLIAFLFLMFMASSAHAGTVTMTLTGGPLDQVVQGSAYVDPGGTLVDTDDLSKNWTNDVTPSPLNLNTLTTGWKPIVYSYTNATGTTQVTRNVQVIPLSINLTLNNPGIIDVVEGMPYIDPGGSLTTNGTPPINWSDVTVSPVNLNTSTVGTKTITYSYTDVLGNTHSETRQVNVISRVVNLSLANPGFINVVENTPYVDPGGSLTDNAYPATVDWNDVVVSPVDTSNVGIVNVSYTYHDGGTLMASDSRVVNVTQANQPPSFADTSVTQTVTQGDVLDPRTLVSCIDPEEALIPSGNLTSTGAITAASNIGAHTFTITCADSQGLSAVPDATVVVTVISSTPTVTMTLNNPGDIDVDQNVAYVDPGGTLSDTGNPTADWANDVDIIPSSIDTTQPVGTAIPVTYLYKDPTTGNVLASKWRTVNIVFPGGNQPPSFPVTNVNITHVQGTDFDPRTAVQCLDNEDGLIDPLTYTFPTGGLVAAADPVGVYVSTINCVDTGGLSVPIDATVIVDVVSSNNPPMFPPAPVPLTHTVPQGVAFDPRTFMPCTDIEDGLIAPANLTIVNAPNGQITAASPDGVYSFEISCVDSTGDFANPNGFIDVTVSSNIAPPPPPPPPTPPNTVVPVTATGGFIPCSGAGCTACHFVQMINSIVIWIIGVMLVVFAVIVVVAGFGLVTSGGNVGAKEEAKKKVTNAIIGLVIILAAWLVVDTLMRALLSGAGGTMTNYGPWATIDCSGAQTRVESAMDNTTHIPVVTSTGVTTPTGVPSGTSITAAAAAADLAAAGVLVKDGAVLDGVMQHVVDEVGILNSDLLTACPTCKPITVTEATGGTHATGVFSHSEGYKLDLRTYDNPGLVDYIQNTYEPAGAWSDGTPLYYDDTTCATYAVENDHIDVVYKTGC